MKRTATGNTVASAGKTAFHRRALIVCAALAFNGAVLSGAVAAPDGHGAFSPSAAVRLDYELPDVLPDSGNLTVPLQLSTPISSGQLHFEVVSSEGLSVQSASNVSFDLHGAAQPLDYALSVVLSADASRYLIVLVTIDGPIGSQSRSYRIDFSTVTAAPSTSGNALKLLPSTAPQ
jgi:hypothetical protein